MKKNILIALAVFALVLSTLACGIDFGGSPLPTLMPTLIPYPTQMPPTVDLNGILLAHGFIRTNYTCDTPCTAYSYASLGLVANAWDDGVLGLGIIVSNIYDGNSQADVFGQVIIDAFGVDVVKWITNHMQASLNADQSGVVGNCKILLTVDYSQTDPALDILLEPTGNGY